MKRHHIFELLFIVLFAQGSVLAADRPITDIICDMGSFTIEQVRDEAAYQAQYDQPKVRSTQLQTIRFSGTFTPTDSDKALVIFSDDGCRVTIDGVVVFDRFNKGQHLPNLEQSFHLLPTFLRKGETVTIVVEYSNILYTGEGDMDGVTLFLFDQGSDFQMCSDGEALLGENSFTDFDGLLAKLTAQSDPLSQYLWSRFSKEAQTALTAKDTPRAQLKSIVVKELNAILQGESIYAQERFAAIALPSKTLQLLAKQPSADELPRLNRWLLEGAFAMQLASSSGCTAHGLRETIAVGDVHQVHLREWRVHAWLRLRRFSVSFPNAAGQVTGVHLQQITATPSERWSLTASAHVGTLTALARLRSFEAEAALTIAGVNPGTVTLTLFDDRDPRKMNIVRNSNDAGQPDSRETVVVAAGQFSPSWTAISPGMTFTFALPTNPASVNWPAIASSLSGELWPTFSITSSVPALVEVLTITRHVGVALVTVRANATLTGVATVTANVGTSTSSATVQVITGGVATLTFSGTGFHDVRKDDNSGNYPTPHWEASRLATGGTNSPVCYVRSGTFTVTAGFTLTAAGTTTGIVRGTLSSGGTVSGTVTLGANSFSVTGLQNSQTVSNSVNYFNPLTITWALSVDGEATYLPMGTTTNVVYVTLETPTASPLFRTVLHLACTGGLATNATAAFQNTWNLFTTGGTGPKDIETWDGKKLCYYRTGFGWANSALNTQQLLASANSSNPWAGHGQCGSFANLLMDAAAANGVAAEWVDIETDNKTIGTTFIVKDWTTLSASYTDPNYKYKLTLVAEADGRTGMVASGQGTDYGDLRKEPTLHGQNTAPPSEAWFRWHFIVKFGGQYYDPSYGVTYADADDFESKAVWGYVLPVSGLDYKVREATGLRNMKFNP
jgi:hypothetical protein